MLFLLASCSGGDDSKDAAQEDAAAELEAQPDLPGDPGEEDAAGPDGVDLAIDEVGGDGESDAEEDMAGEPDCADADDMDVFDADDMDVFDADDEEEVVDPCAEVAPHVPYFTMLNDKTTLIVDEHPFIMLGVFDQRGFSSWDTVEYEATGTMVRTPGPGDRPKHPYYPDNEQEPTIEEYELYYAWAGQFGFNTVALTFSWKFFETGDEETEEYADGTDGSDDYPLLWHRQAAEAHGMKLIMRWFGSNIGDDTSAAPSYIEGDEETYLKLGGVYDLCEEAILEKETRAITKVAEWIRDSDPEHTYIMLQLNNEIKYLHAYHDSHSDTCRERFDECDYAGDASAGTIEQCNQKIFQAYYQALAAAVHAVIPDFITYVNVFLPRLNYPDNPDPGAPDPYDERDPETHMQEGFDPYLESWLDSCPDITFIGPDLYHIGPAEGELDEPFPRPADWNWWYGLIYPPWYMGSRNVPIRAESGVIITHNEKPHRDIFKLLGDPEINLVGDVVFGLSGSLNHTYFQGLISNDFKFLFDAIYAGPILLVPNFYKEFLFENSFRSVRAAGPMISKFQNTDNLVYFISDHTNGYDASGTYTVGGMSVDVTDFNTWGEDRAHRGKARGIIIRTGERDFTILGVDFRAMIIDDLSGWDLVVERGYWDRGCWVSEGEALEGSWLLGEDGSVYVEMSPDNVPTEEERAGLVYEDFEEPGEYIDAVRDWFLEHDRSNQYMVRIYDAREE